MKSELAALDRKIQLELAPKHEETTSQGQEQGGGQDLPKAENVPKPDDAARDYIRDHRQAGHSRTQGGTQYENVTQGGAGAFVPVPPFIYGDTRPAKK